MDYMLKERIKHVTNAIEQGETVKFSYVNQPREIKPIGFFGKDLAGQSKGFGNWYSESGGFTELFASASHLDSPSSTSAITYKIYIKTENSNSAMTIGSTARRQTITLMEIAG